MAKLNKKGALALTADMDQMLGTLQRVAATIGQHGEVLGVPSKYASDFQRTAYELTKKADALADHIERQAGVNKQALSGGGADHQKNYPANGTSWDAEQIGKEVAGPHHGDSDEAGYMNGEFTQQENRELRERVEQSELGPNKTTTEPQKPSPGIQASLKSLLRSAADMDEEEMDETAKKKASTALALAADVLSKLASEEEPDDEEGDEEEDEGEEAKKKANYNLYA